MNEDADGFGLVSVLATVMAIGLLLVPTSRFALQTFQMATEAQRNAVAASSLVTASSLMQTGSLGAACVDPEGVTNALRAKLALGDPWTVSVAPDCAVVPVLALVDISHPAGAGVTAVVISGGDAMP